jgi:hypothetical protein
MLRKAPPSSPATAEAKLRYIDGDYQILRQGAFVRCAVTGDPIPLEDLRYWSVELQEAYKSPEVSLQRYIDTHKSK